MTRQISLDDTPGLTTAISEKFSTQGDAYANTIERNDLDFDQIKLNHPSIKVVGLVGFDTERETFVVLKMKSLKDSENDGQSMLSKRENEVLQLVTLGHTNLQIAKQLIIAESTVKAHLQNIFAKLKVRSRTQAATLALQQGWVMD